MVRNYPWYTSNDLIDAVKRKSRTPLNQATYKAADILDIANDMMLTTIVPEILVKHEGFFTYNIQTPIVSNVSRYPIPPRAIGMRLNDLFYSDVDGNPYEMVKINDGDRFNFTRGYQSSTVAHKYFIENNDAVMVPNVLDNAVGNLNFVIFMRPNTLVPNERAAFIDGYKRRVVIDNTKLTAGCALDINGVHYTVVSGAPATNEFNLGVTNAATASNLVAAIGASASILSTSSDTVVISSLSQITLASIPASGTSEIGGFGLTTTTWIEFDQLPANYTDPDYATVWPLFTAGCVVDFLQWLPGHKTRIIDKTILNIFGTDAEFNISDLPANLTIGDYICLAGECIVPQIPTELHHNLAQSMIIEMFSSDGDVEAAQLAQGRMQQLEQRQTYMIDNRVENSPPKVLNRFSPLRTYKRSNWRRS